MIWLLMILNMLFVVCDALRDRGVQRLTDWWEWHIVKWIEFFGMELLLIAFAIRLGYIPLTPIVGFIGVLYAVLANCIWHIIYERKKMTTEIMIIAELSTIDPVNDIELESILLDISQVNNIITYTIIKKEIINEKE